jgi:hypothetical protein
MGLKNRTNTAQKYRVLRALISYPAEPDVIIENIQEAGEHSVATIDLDMLDKSLPMVELMKSLKRNLDVKKRKSNHLEEENRYSKKQKSDHLQEDDYSE